MTFKSIMLMKIHSTSMSLTDGDLSMKRSKANMRFNKSKDHRYERRKVREMMHRLDARDLED